MLINCPECKTGFSVPRNAIKESGKKVKCSKCSHIWLQKPIPYDKQRLEDTLRTSREKDLTIKVQDNTNLPVAKKNNLLLKKIAFSCVLLLLTVCVSVLANFSKIPFVKSAISIDDYSPLHFYDFKVEKEVIDKKNDIFLSGKLVNTSDKRIKLPEVHITVLSKGGRTMSEASVKLDSEYIEPFSYIDFKPDITGISGNADSVNVKFGNWYEL